MAAINVLARRPLTPPLSPAYGGEGGNLMTQIAPPPRPKFQPHHAQRPMLARDADAMYWMSRYVERVEHVARLLLVNSNLLMDVGDLAPTLQQRQWQSVLTVLRVEALPPGEGPLAA